MEAGVSKQMPIYLDIIFTLDIASNACLFIVIYDTFDVKETES